MCNMTHAYLCNMTHSHRNVTHVCDIIHSSVWHVTMLMVPATFEVSWFLCDYVGFRVWHDHIGTKKVARTIASWLCRWAPAPSHRPPLNTSKLNKDVRIQKRLPNHQKKNSKEKNKGRQTGSRSFLNCFKWSVRVFSNSSAIFAQLVRTRHIRKKQSSTQKIVLLICIVLFRLQTENSNPYGFEMIDPQARVPNYCFQ